MVGCPEIDQEQLLLQKVLVQLTNLFLPGSSVDLGRSVGSGLTGLSQRLILRDPGARGPAEGLVAEMWK